MNTATTSTTATSEVNGNRNGHTDPQIEVQVEAQVEDTPAEKEAKKVARAALTKKLFADWKQAKDDLETLKAKIEGAEKRVSVSVGEILNRLGKATYNYKGEEMTPTKRGDLYYFRSKNEKKIETVGE